MISPSYLSYNYASRKAFTLVELIVVITILAILATIWFVSLQWYSISARDSVRTSDTKMFLKALQVYNTKNNSLPLPDTMTEIYSDGELLSYQWELAKGVIMELWQAEIPLDPILDTPYIYAVNRTQSKVQVLAHFENNISDNFLRNIHTSHAIADRMFPKSFWDSVAVFLQGDKTLFQSGALDIASVWWSFYMYTPAAWELYGTKVELMRQSPYVTCNSLLQSGLSSGNGSYKIIPMGDNWLDVYCDMETDGGWWTEIPYISDLEYKQHFSGGDVRRYLPDDFELWYSSEAIQAIQSHSSEGRQKYIGVCQGVIHYKFDGGGMYDFSFNFKFLNGETTTYSSTWIYDTDIRIWEDECSDNDKNSVQETIFEIYDIRLPLLNVESRDNGNGNEKFGSELSKNPAWLR